VDSGWVEEEWNAMSDPAASQAPQHLLFIIAGAECALPAEVVQGVERTLEITPVPNTASWVAGVVQAWGGIVSVVDLQAFFGLQSQPLTPRSRLVVVARGDLTIGLLVNAVVEMRSLGEDLRNRLDLRNAPEWAQPYASGALQVGERLVTIFDPTKLVLSPKMQNYRAD
jgi:purine-binding chemotaxis protein CheW